MKLDYDLTAMQPALGSLRSVEKVFQARCLCRQTDHGLMVWCSDSHFIFLACFSNAQVAGLDLDRDYYVSTSNRRVHVYEEAGTSDKFRFEDVMFVLNKAVGSATDVPVAVLPEHMAIAYELFKSFGIKHMQQAQSCYGSELPFGLVLATHSGGEVSDVDLVFLCARPNPNSTSAPEWGKQATACQDILMAIDPPF